VKAPRTRIASLVAEQTLKGAPTKKLSRQVAAYLLEEGRVSELDSILRDVQADWAAAGIVEVIAASAYPISSSVSSQIKAIVKQIYPNAKQIIVSEVIDSEVIGGVRLSMPGKQLDMSVEAKLNKFKQLTMSGKD
jgi:F0F1-type ATP synthase delta subunit